jgi:hypothetical protein
MEQINFDDVFVCVIPLFLRIVLAIARNFFVIVYLTINPLRNEVHIYH